MAIDIIQWTDSSNNIIKWVYEGDSEPITNQSEKHINLQSNNSADRKDFYNSAIIYDVQYTGYNNWFLGICIFAESPFTLTQYIKLNYSSDWEQGTVRTYDYQSGDYYSVQYFTSNTLPSGTYDTTGFNDVYYSLNRTYSFYLPAFNNITDYMNFITQPYIAYQFSSVGSISGKLGVFNLSTIKDTDINNGDPVSNATSSAFNVLQQATKLSVLAENKSELTPVIYTDDINYLSLKDLTNNKCELKFYLHNRSFLKITNVSINAFLSILIDEENKAAKPSIIYKNGSSYSYNQEEPSADTMKHLYEWLMINEQNIKKKTGLWKN